MFPEVFVSHSDHGGGGVCQEGRGLCQEGSLPGGVSVRKVSVDSGQQSVCTLLLLLPTNEVWGKVIFSLVCVKNSVHSGGSASVHAGSRPPPQEWRTPQDWRTPPKNGDPPKNGESPPRMENPPRMETPQP